jgi:acyl-CoA thioesterase FadM
MGDGRMKTAPIAFGRLALSLVLSAALFNCSPESPPSGEADRSKQPSPAVSTTQSGSLQSNRLPIVRLARIFPEPLMGSQTLSVRVEADDPDGDSVMFRHQWFVNGQPITGETGPTLASYKVKRGDQVSVEVIPLDGKAEGKPYRSNATTVGNSPPEIARLVLQPGEPHVGDRLTVEVEGIDADQDSIRYTFRWWRNRKLLTEGEGASLETIGFARDDVLMVEVTPHDETSDGRPFLAPPLTIVNSHPQITSVPPTDFEENRYAYTVKATDPDGDPLTYALESAPSGMTIDSKTGRIEWRMADGTKGTHRIRVSVRDNHDGYGFQEFELALPAPSS